MINPDLPKIKLAFKGKDIEIPYHYPCTQGMQYIEILDGKGNEHRFYKGMYSPDIWFAKDTEHWDAEFVRLLTEEFDKLKPEYNYRNERKMMWDRKRWWEM